jgi:dTDP-4-amino-4,6-dideoxygalactose transaminase
MIPLSVPYLTVDEEIAAAEAIRSGWVAQGPRVAEFEKVVAGRCHVEYAVAVSSCTAALHLALVAVGVGPGDEVICPSLSFIATANAVRHAGAEPVFAEIDERTYNLDPEAAAERITSRTKAILVVHQVGLPADLDAFLDLGNAHGIPIVEDAACALGSRYKGYPIGCHGVMACFSFHPRKIVTTGEGGMIVTSDGALAERLRRLRQHGMTASDAMRHASLRVLIESYEGVGYNYRLSDVQAAVGCAQMRKLEWIVERRRELATLYGRRLAGHRWISPPYVPNYAEPNFQSYAVRLAGGAPLSRNELMQALLDRGVSTRRGIMLAHRESAYSSRAWKLPRSERASDNSLLLPLYPQMPDSTVQRVVDAIDEAMDSATRAAA